LEQALQNADAIDPATEEMREKLRLIRGVLYWNMNASYKARLWHARKEQRELEVAVKEARRRWTLIERARVDSPKHTEDFAARVTLLKPRIENLTTRLDGAGQAQNLYLANIAIKELEAQKERLAAYGVQAQFALAAIYDRANSESSRPPAATTAPAPTSEPAATEAPSSETAPSTEPQSAPSTDSETQPPTNKGITPPPVDVSPPAGGAL
jgi:hypothetical protein